MRVLAHGGTLVQTGVASPARFEWTPWYFKELQLVGSNAFGIEEVDGVRKHGMEHYLDLVRGGRVDLTGHADPRVPARPVARRDDDDHRPRRDGAIKVAFDFR